jgi:serine/threonine protein kinase
MDNDFLFIQMELCDSNLKGWMELNSCTESRVSAVRSGAFLQLAQGIKDIHDSGILHRDLKPENIFLKTDGKADCIWKIGDMGLSKQMDSQGRFTSRVGTPLYWPKEISSSGHSPKSDIFSLGLIFLEILSGFESDKEKSIVFHEVRTLGSLSSTMISKLNIAFAAEVDIVERMVLENVEKRISSNALLDMFEARRSGFNGG